MRGRTVIELAKQGCRERSEQCSSNVLSYFSDENEVPADDDDEEEEEEVMNVLELLPPDEKASAHKAVFVNDLKLSDFREVLNKRGISAEISSGILWCCNDTIALRRVGRPSPTAYAMKNNGRLFFSVCSIRSPWSAVRSYWKAPCLRTTT